MCALSKRKIALPEFPVFLAKNKEVHLFYTIFNSGHNNWKTMFIIGILLSFLTSFLRKLILFYSCQYFYIYY